MTRFTLSAPFGLFGHAVMVGAELSSPPDAVAPGAAAAPRRAGAAGATTGAAVEPCAGASAALGASRRPHARSVTSASGQRRYTGMMYYGIAPDAHRGLDRPASPDPATTRTTRAISTATTARR